MIKVNWRTEVERFAIVLEKSNALREKRGFFMVNIWKRVRELRKTPAK